MTEYASNAIISVFTDIFAFMTNYDFEPRMSFDLIESFESRFIRERILRIKEMNMTKKMKKVFEFTKRKLIKSQNNQKTNADKKRVLALDYKEDDLV
jgi:aminopeptidase N